MPFYLEINLARRRRRSRHVIDTPLAVEGIFSVASVIHQTISDVFAVFRVTHVRSG